MPPTHIFNEHGDKKDKVSVQLRKIIDLIDLPISIRTATLPGDDIESLFIAVQTGKILCIRKGQLSVFLDIQQNILKLGINNTPYDERGLIGLAFHPRFKYNGKFYIYYSQDGSQHKAPSHIKVDPCNPSSLKQDWKNKSHYDHVDVLEEWIYSMKEEECNYQRDLFAVYQPFFNNNGRDNLYFSVDEELIIGIGDGGSSLDPFNLAQNDNSPFGKLISINLNNICLECGVYPISDFRDLLPCQRKAYTLLVKGIHNTCHPSYDDCGYQYLPNTGETGFESVYAFPEIIKKHNILNLGWRPWEGIMPTTKEEKCSSASNSVDVAYKILIWEQEACPLLPETVILEEGESIAFISNDNQVHSVVLADSNWKIAHSSKYYLKSSKKLDGTLTFDEVGEYYLLDPYCKSLKVKIQVLSSSNKSRKPLLTQDCVVFVKESLYIENRYQPLTSIHHKNLKKSVNEITGGEFYRGCEIKGLENSYVFSDLSKRDVPEGSLYYVRMGKDPQNFKEAKPIKIAHQFKKDTHLFVSMGSNESQDKLYLGVYYNLGVTDRKLGAVYEIVPSSENYDSVSSDASESEILNTCLSDTSDINTIEHNNNNNIIEHNDKIEKCQCYERGYKNCTCENYVWAKYNSYWNSYNEEQSKLISNPDNDSDSDSDNDSDNDSDSDNESKSSTCYGCTECSTI
jgi:plastocyanin